jgi:polysaccharide biosynthesis protein PslG
MTRNEKRSRTNAVTKKVSPMKHPLKSLRPLGLLLLLLLSLARGAAADPGSFGVNIHAPQGVELAAELDRVKAAGLGWVRIDFIWAVVEPRKGAYNWHGYDALAAAARARGLQIYATLAYTPAWATDGPELSGVPRNPDDWRRICQRAAMRYRGKITYWGLWNEPNLQQFWAGSRDQYIDVILKTGADAIHAGNRGAKVGGPDLAHLVSGDADWYDWLRESLLEAGDRLDFITHHIYDSSGNRSVTSKLEASTLFGGHPALWGYVPPSVKEVLESTGWTDKPVWLTETGWESSRVGESGQASYYSGLLSDWFTGRSGRGWLTKVFFYELKDSADPGSSTWGILRPDGSPKPAYDAYQAFVAGH